MTHPMAAADTTSLTCAAFAVPLATNTRDVCLFVREVYEALGLDTVEYVGADGEKFVVPTTLINSARQELDARRYPNDDIRYVVRTSVDVPHHQPRVSAVKATIYRALGVDTVDIDVGGTVYTVLTKHIIAAKAQLARGETSGAPTESYPTINLALNTYYEGPPPPTIVAAARLYGGKFARVLVGPADTVYWVLATPLYPIGNVLERLGACV